MTDPSREAFEAFATKHWGSFRGHDTDMALFGWRAALAWKAEQDARNLSRAMTMKEAHR